MTELGVYILGAMALAILAAAGFWAADETIVACAVAASGLAYVSQINGFVCVESGIKPFGWVNFAGLISACLVWTFGFLQLVT
jgi:hypothetical protein